MRSNRAATSISSNTKETNLLENDAQQLGKFHEKRKNIFCG